MIFIKNGRVVDAVRRVDEVMDVLVDDGVIVATGDRANELFDGEKSGAQVIDATGLVVAPGLVDTHVHFRDPGFT